MRPAYPDISATFRVLACSFNILQLERPGLEHCHISTTSELYMDEADASDTWRPTGTSKGTTWYAAMTSNMFDHINHCHMLAFRGRISEVPWASPKQLSGSTKKNTTMKFCCSIHTKEDCHTEQRSKQGSTQISLHRLLDGRNVTYNDSRCGQSQTPISSDVVSIKAIFQQ